MQVHASTRRCFGRASPSAIRRNQRSRAVIAPSRAASSSRIPAQRTAPSRASHSAASSSLFRRVRGLRTGCSDRAGRRTPAPACVSTTYPRWSLGRSILSSSMFVRIAPNLILLVSSAAFCHYGVDQADPEGSTGNQVWVNPSPLRSATRSGAPRRVPKGWPRLP